MLYVVQLSANSLAFDGSLDGGFFVATGITVAVKNPAASATLTLKNFLKIPPELFAVAGPDYQLKSKQELTQELAALEAEVKNAADSVVREAKVVLLQEFRARRAELQEKLQSMELTIQAFGGASFFGVNAIAGVVVTATAGLYLDALLEEGVSASEIIFVAKAMAALNITVNGNPHEIGAALSIHVTRGDVIEAIPEFTIPVAAWPAMPKLDLGFPPVPFPSLSFNGLTVPGIDRLLRFDIPKLQSPPITIKWTGGAPQVECKVQTGSLTTATAEAKNGGIYWEDATELATIVDFGFTLTSASLTVTGTITAVQQSTPSKRPINVNDPCVPVILRGIAELTAEVTGTYNLATRTGSLGLRSTLKIPRLEIEARSDPKVFLAITLIYITTFDAGTGKASGRLTELAIIEPYPMELIAAGLHEAISGVLRLVAFIKALDVPSPDLPDMPDPSPLLKRLAEFAAAIARWAAEAAGQVAGALAALAEAVAEIIARIFDLLKKAGSTLISHIAIEVRLDAETFALRQIWISPLGQDDGSEVGIETVTALGITLKIPRQWMPALVLDVSQAPLIALIVQPSAQATTLSTDLWFDRPGAPVEALRDSKKDGPPSEPLITLTADLTRPAAIALVAIQHGKATFFRKLEDPLVVDVLDEIGVGTANSALNKYKLALLKKPPRFSEFKIGGAGDDLKISVSLANDAKERILPFLSAPKPDDAAQTSGGGILDSLSQYIRIADQPFAPVVSDNSVTLPIPIIVSVSGFESATTLILTLDLEALHISLKADNKVDIIVPQAELDKPRTLLGLDARFTYAKATPLPDNKYKLFVLNFSGGDIRLSLAEGIDLELWYRRIASEGRGLVFKVEDLVIGRHGIDLEARADRDVPVTLAGVEVPFRFDEGGVSIKAGRLTSFAVKGSGQLPPALIGEANVKIAIAMGLKDGRLTVQSAEAILDKGNDPIVCETTRFTFTLQKIELLARDFGADGIHFWFALTGSARFTPGGSEFDGGLLQNLDDLEIVFDKAPLTTNAALLKNFLEFHIGVRMKRAVNFFNIFKFELRGFGFHPSVERFGRMPALSISGQVEFVKAGDTVSPKIDFHKLWIAPPKDGSALPQIAFDGLGVEIKLGAATLEATAITVDGTLPSLDRQVAYPEAITAQGFMARGRLCIKGWAPLAAAMGFLELDRPGGRQHAFFAFAQQEELSVEIPTPIGMLYLREIGFGFGKSYTFAGLVAADYVRSPDQLVAVLDDVSKRQGELATFAAWAPELEGDRFTLAMRALFTVATASNSGTLSDSERNLSNPIMFDVAAALRSDLTFLMTARGWIATNYHAFVHGEMEGEGKSAKVVVARDFIRTNPPLRGYLYISAPRQQFLGRLIADGKGYIGKTPILHPIVREAMSGVSWSATLFIQPGLFHFEMGWPYELKFEFAKKMGPAEIGIRLEGGLVFRIEDSALLYGIAFRGSGYAQLGGQVGGRSFGASAVARVDMDLAAKFIAYISLRDPNETLFYGAIDLAVTVSIRVRIWLEFRVFRARIHLEIGLSFNRTLTLALELAISPKELGARGVATVVVSGFGRTLRLGISLGINEGALERARVKVERFLAIGLDAIVPEPAKGLAPPPPASSPANAATQAEQQTVIEEEKNQVATAIAAKIDTSEIMAPSFWAVLFEVPAPATADREFVMTLIPRDETSVGDLSEVDGTFYPPPPPVDLDDPNKPSRPNIFVQYDFELSNMPIAITRLLGRNVLEWPVGNGGLQFDDTAVIGISEDSADEITLPNFLYHCFIGVQAADPSRKFIGDTLYGDDVLLKQPPLAVIAKTRQRLPADEARATETLRRAARDQMIGEEESITDYVRAVEERRSGVASAIGESAAVLATTARAGGPNGQRYRWPERRNGIDARDLGLTFVVTETELRALFDDIGNTDKPVSSKFLIATRCSKHGQPQDPKPVHLLNPPARFFSEAHPRLAGLAAKRGKTGIMLDWDLEPQWEVSRGPYHDPEFLLRHYRIERLVLDSDSVVPKFKPYSVTTKAAVPFLLSTKGVIQPLRQAAQLVDDLADIAAVDRELAEVLLHRGPDAHTNWTNYPNYKLLYTIVPVDIAGSEGLPTPIVFTPARPAPTVFPLLKAEIIFQYERLADPVGGTHEPPLLRLFLRIDDPLAHSADSTSGAQQRLPGDNTIYQLRLRREIAVTGGIYGVDALTKARERPTAQDFAQDAAGRDLDVFVVLKDRDKVLPNLNDGLGLRYTDADRFQPLEIVGRVAHPPSHPIRGTARFELIAGDGDPAATLAMIREHVGVNDPVGVRAVRVAAERKRFVSPADSAKTFSTPSGWLPADMALVVLDPDAKETRPPVAVETVVETFEHPRRLSFDALSLEDLDGRADRLVVVQPDPHKHLADLIAAVAPAGPAHVAPPAGALLRLVDPQRRTATRIAWNTRPSAAVTGRSGFADPKAYEKLIGGFDLFETDLAELPNITDLPDYARRIARVQRLPETLRGLDPAEIADFEKVEAFYPSEMARVLAQKAAMGGEGRAAWFSPAETILAWAEIGPRASLGLAPVPAELMAVFDKGQPVAIEFSFKEGGPLSLDRKEGSAKVEFQFDKALFTKDIDMPGIPGPRPWIATIRRKDQEPFTPGALTQLLRSLWWSADDASAESIRERYESKPDVFQTVTLLISGHNGERVTGDAAIEVNLDLPLHPFLADVIDYMRWEIPNDEEKNPSYRRYEPVLDGPPPTKAESFSEFANEFPPERDPYGWAFLRTIGLATGVKLFDMEAAEYVASQDTLTLVNAAISAIAPRYATAGAHVRPFVEIISRPGGLYQLASFDSAIREEVTVDETRNLLTHEGLSLIQLSLRPSPERFLDKTLVGYCLVKSKKSGDITIEPLQSLGGIEGGVLYEVLDVAGGLGSSRVVRVARSEDTVARTLLAPGEAIETKVTIAAPGVDSSIALIRIVVAGTVRFEQAVTNLATDDLDVSPVSEPSAMTPSLEPEPFGRFGWLDPKVLDVLHLGSTQHDLDVKPQPDATLNIKRLLNLIVRRFSKVERAALYETAEPATRIELLAKLQRFSVRFMDQCAGVRGGRASIPFALATVTRPDPWRVAPAEDGRMDILIVHEDAWARRRRYVVRPFGRYENIADATPGDQASADKPALDKLRANDPAFEQRSVDVVLPRTHPVRPPVILSARRLDIWLDKPPGRDPKQRREGRQLEFVLARHAEEIISESNRQVSDGYQFSHIGLEFYREFSAPRWARGFGADHDWPQLNDHELVASFGDEAGRRPAPPALSFSSEKLTEPGMPDELQLPRRIADGWSGISAVRTRDVPYFYRLHALAHAAAGVVVSEPSAAMIAEGRPTPRFPWVLPPGWHSPWTVPEASWTMWIDEEAEEAEVRVALPLMRHFDGLSPEDYDLWLKDTVFDDKRVLRLPDAAASYALALETDVTGGSRSVVAELFPQVSDTSSAYTVIAGQTQFEVTNVVAASFVAEHWQALVPFKKKVEAVTTVAAPVLTLGGEGRTLLDRMEIRSSGWSMWVADAPTRRAAITITRPAGTLTPGGMSTIDWTPFNTEINRLIALYEGYSGADAVLNLLRSHAAAPDPGRNQDHKWHTKLGHGDAVAVRTDLEPWLAGLPRSWENVGLLGTPTPGAENAFVVEPVMFASDWILPKPAERDATARAAFSDVLRLQTVPVPATTEAMLNVKIFSVIRASMFAGVSSTALTDETKPFAGFVPLTRVAVDDLEPITKVDPVDVAAPFELLLRAEFAPGGDWDDEKRTVLRALILALETCKLPGSLRALSTLEAIDAGEATVGTGSISPFTLVMPHTVSDGVTMELVGFATTLGVALTWEVKALTMRRPPDDGEITALIDKLPMADRKKAGAAILAMGQDQALGPHRKLVLNLYRGFAMPLTHDLGRRLA